MKGDCFKISHNISDESENNGCASSSGGQVWIEPRKDHGKGVSVRGLYGQESEDPDLKSGIQDQ